MTGKYFLIVSASILFFGFTLSGRCFGKDLPIKNKIALQKNIEDPVVQTCLFLAQESSLGQRLINLSLKRYITRFQLQQDSPNSNKNIQIQSDIQKTNSEPNNSTLTYTYILLIIIGLGYVFFRIIEHRNKLLIALNQKEIREQTINELKIDRQLVASRAVLIGEEKERGRLSRELHDGLGGMLSGLKLAISGIKDNNSLPVEINEKIDVALTQLNASISELRSIAQNLMPEALINFGLKDALNDFCTNLGSNKDVEVSFMFYGEPIRFDHSIENSLYRIAQEAINNALKYSGATKIIVQLIQDESWVNLTIQDNGHGFDPETIQEKKSGGLKNIRARAESFDGNFHIDSQPGIGTEIIVELIHSNIL